MRLRPLFALAILPLVIPASSVALPGEPSTLARRAVDGYAVGSFFDPVPGVNRFDVWVLRFTAGEPHATNGTFVAITSARVTIRMLSDPSNRRVFSPIPGPAEEELNVCDQRNPSGEGFLSLTLCLPDGFGGSAIVDFDFTIEDPAGCVDPLPPCDQVSGFHNFWFTPLPLHDVHDWDAMDLYPEAVFLQ